MPTKHFVNPANPTNVIGAEQYRVSFTFCLTPEHPNFAALEQGCVEPQHRRPDGYGLAFLQSEEVSLTYVGSITQIEDYQRQLAADQDGARPGALDIAAGVVYKFWPQTPAWEPMIPNHTWHPGGHGVLAEIAHRGTSVVVYEFVEDRDGVQVPVVGWHCLSCHSRDPFGHTVRNNGPQDRWWMARAARIHAHRAERDPKECRPLDPELVRLVLDIASKQDGRHRQPVSEDSLCATSGPCARLRHARAVAAARTR